MTGYEAFKEARENSGYSMRQFAQMVNISLSSLFYYESGEKSLLNIPVKKAKLIFSLLDISIDKFFAAYYAKEIDVEDKLAKWKEENKQEYCISNLQLRFKNRIFKLRERGKIADENFFESIYKESQEIFNKLSLLADDKGNITEEEYKQYVIPLSYQLGIYLEKVVPEEDRMKNETAIRINDCLLHTDYNYKDLAEFIGITTHRLSVCKKSNGGYDDMQVGTALKICRVFQEEFEVLFSSANDV